MKHKKFIVPIIVLILLLSTSPVNSFAFTDERGGEWESETHYKIWLDQFKYGIKEEVGDTKRVKHRLFRTEVRTVEVTKYQGETPYKEKVEREFRIPYTRNIYFNKINRITKSMEHSGYFNDFMSYNKTFNFTKNEFIYLVRDNPTTHLEMIADTRVPYTKCEYLDDGSRICGTPPIDYDEKLFIVFDGFLAQYRYKALCIDYLYNDEDRPYLRSSYLTPEEYETLRSKN